MRRTPVVCCALIILMATFGGGPVSGAEFVPVTTDPETGQTCIIHSGLPGESPDGPTDGDPVSLSTGLYTQEATDLVLPDVTPIRFTRAYRTKDTVSRAFGIGQNHTYSQYLYRNDLCSEMRMGRADGSYVRFVRTTGTNCFDSVLQHTETQSDWYGATITWSTGKKGWELKQKDGATWLFSLYGFPMTYTDRNSNITVFTRAQAGGQAGNLTRITSPNGRYLILSYDLSNRVSQLTDVSGRTVVYTYDASGRLWKVTDPAGGITEYTYDTSHRLLTLKDPRGNLHVTNVYDANGRVFRQTQANATTYQFAYTLDGNGKVTQTDVIDPRGYTRRVTFNSAGHSLTDTEAFGQPEAQTTTYERQASTNLLLSETDALNRKTAYTYDSKGNVLTVTRLATTPEAITTTYTYDPIYNQVTSITDPLNHATTLGYDTQGNLTSITNALNKTIIFTVNPAGQLLTIKDPLSNVTTFTYEQGDLVKVTDALNRESKRFIDIAGRLRSVTNPLGQRTLYAVDALDRITQLVDAISGATAFTYDANSNLLTVTDAKSQQTVYTYNTMDRVATRKPPLLRNGMETYGYDGNGNLTSVLDRKSQTTTVMYDPLNRRTKTTYQDGTSTNYTYDAGNRLTLIQEKNSGNTVTATITRTYDGLDRLTQEVTAQGTLTYTYDNANRRATMTVAGQPTVNYTYDNANRLTQITQGANLVTIGYDDADRRASLTLPNGNSVVYAYNAASELLSLTYKQGATVIGDLTYTYDLAGNRIKTGGSFSRATIPPALTTASYNVNNQVTAFGAVKLTYDLNGNLASVTEAKKTTTYTWNVRNQLTGISGPSFAASFTYDSLGRRTGKTVQGATTNFVYDGLNPVQEKAGATVTANLLTGLGIDEFFQRTDGVGNRALLTDALGSTVALGDGTGTIQTQYTYEPFGYATTSGQANSTSYKYTGREDDGSGLYYYRARYYHPRLQRFISEDPLGFGGGDANLYGYVWHNPLNYIDPSGYNTAVGALSGFAIGGPPGALIGGAIATVGAAGVAWWILHRDPPNDAYDPEGAKAPGKPTADDGFVSPKSGDDWVQNPNPGSGGAPWGWKDINGDVWCPTGKSPGRAHGGPHWDVESPGGGYRHKTLYQPDALDRITQLVDAISGATAFTYDANSNLLTVTDAKSQQTVYTYNTMNRTATRKDPLLKTETYTYDNNGNVATVTDRKSQVTTYTYDLLNRKTKATYQDGTSTNYTYDAGNRLTQIQEKDAGNTVTATITRTYDDLDRLTQEVTAQGTLTYTYDNASRRATMTVAGQPTVNYTYDNANRLTQITQGANLVTIGYDDADRRASLTLPNGNSVVYAYNAASELLSLTYKQGATVIGDLTYTYDAAGNRIKQGGSFARSSIPPALATASYNANNQQTVFGSNTETYDLNGNLSTVTDASGTATYTWNARNQLVAITATGVSASFQYDSFGRRTGKTIQGITTNFVYDGLNPVQGKAGATVTANLLTGLGIDEFLTRTDGAGTRGLLTDALGSTVALGDGTGTLQTQYTYEPFGYASQTGSANTNSYKYTAREDDGSGLFYYRARYYHPRLQRFISEDPVGIRGGINFYRYASQNPLLLRDPLGLFDWGNTADALSNVFAVNGSGEYYGSAIGGAIGGVAFSPFGPWATAAGAIVGSQAGGIIGLLTGVGIGIGVAVQRGLVQGIKAAVVAFFVVGVLMAMIIIPVQVIATRRLTSEECQLNQVREFKMPGAVLPTLELLYKALSELAFIRDIEMNINGRYITAKTRMSWASFGEVILVEVKKRGRPTLQHRIENRKQLPHTGRQRQLLRFPGLAQALIEHPNHRIPGGIKGVGSLLMRRALFSCGSAGNRIKQGGSFARSTIPPALATASYNVNNQQTTFGTNTLTYDFNGNLQPVTDAGGTATYNWNARNQLAGISSTGFAASFSYDSFGRRTGKTIQGTTTNFVYDGLNPVQEKAGATVTANLLTGLGIDEFLTRTDGAGTRGLLTDALGSTVALGDNTGTIQTQYTYEPFGYATQTGAANTNSYKFTGREDDGTGLLYYRARYYHPRLQRFISEDPIGFRGGDLNLFGYVRENPLYYTDPSGECPWCVAAVIGGLTDLAVQLIMNGGQVGCIDWWEAFVSGAASGAGVGIAQNLGKRIWWTGITFHSLSLLLGQYQWV
ncbi:hypothetical protein B566_EDAN000406 [Ephemera danica]|nr:hypothetical protein B566_EDAN000406 [Ephemera danica]